MGTENPISTEAAAIIAGDYRTAAKVITRLEGRASEDTRLNTTLRELHAARGNARIIGITGAPGCGKSTLVDQLIAQYRKSGKTVAVLAVDPSSPFSGGAILGDRVRLQRHATDEKVFIRSLSSRGALGGLTEAVGHVLAVLSAMPWDVIIVETVGVGQNEIEIARHAATVIVVETPASGDFVQSFKSGVMEVGDIFVVNKADQEGSERRVRAIIEALKNSGAYHSRLPAVLKTDALRGSGIEELVASIESHAEFSRSHVDVRRQRLIMKTKPLPC